MQKKRKLKKWLYTDASCDNQCVCVQSSSELFVWVVSIDLFLISFMPFLNNGVYFASLTDAFLPTPSYFDSMGCSNIYNR